MPIKSDLDAFREELSVYQENLASIIEEAREMLLLEAVPEKFKQRLERDAISCVAIMQKYQSCLCIEDQEEFTRYMRQINPHIDDELCFIDKFWSSIHLCLKLFGEGPEFSTKKLLNPSQWIGVSRRVIPKKGTFMDTEELLKQEKPPAYETPLVVSAIQGCIGYLDEIIEYASMVAEFPHLTTEAALYVKCARIEFEQTQKEYVALLTMQYVEVLEKSQEDIFNRIKILHDKFTATEMIFDQYLVYSDDTPAIWIRSNFKFCILPTKEC